MNSDCCINVVTVDNPTTVVIPAPIMVVTIGTQGPQGIQGPPGSGSAINGICGVNIAIGTVCVLLSGFLYPADPTNVAHAPFVVGVATEAGNTSDVIAVAQLGDVGMTGLVVGDRYFVGLLGMLSTSPLAVGSTWMKYMGTAQTTTNLVLVSSISILLD